MRFAGADRALDQLDLDGLLFEPAPLDRLGPPPVDSPLRAIRWVNALLYELLWLRARGACSSELAAELRALAATVGKLVPEDLRADVDRALKELEARKQPKDQGPQPEQHAALVGGVRDGDKDAQQGRMGHRGTQASYGVIPVPAMHDDLGDHRVVVRWHLGAGGHEHEVGVVALPPAEHRPAPHLDQRLAAERGGIAEALGQTDRQVLAYKRDRDGRRAFSKDKAAAAAWRLRQG